MEQLLRRWSRATSATGILEGSCRSSQCRHSGGAGNVQHGSWAIGRPARRKGIFHVDGGCRPEIPKQRILPTKLRTELRAGHLFPLSDHAGRASHLQKPANLQREGLARGDCAAWRREADDLAEHPPRALPQARVGSGAKDAVGGGCRASRCPLAKRRKSCRGDGRLQHRRAGALAALVDRRDRVRSTQLYPNEAGMLQGPVSSLKVAGGNDVART
mmetsp:Transcript_87694/g.183337  ORF Transcript_87694/g.183337 Transcript_87694/m.183337 type:complete len:216 (-) Transcript_87694:179-826(-)